jgi:hypothetical protein
MAGDFGHRIRCGIWMAQCSLLSFPLPIYQCPYSHIVGKFGRPSTSGIGIQMLELEDETLSVACLGRMQARNPSPLLTGKVKRESGNPYFSHYSLYGERVW